MGLIRYQAAEPNRRGAHVGVFGLVNGLARSGALTEAEHAWWRASNDWYDAAYPDPALTDPSLFDRTVHPVTACWFKDSAVHLLERVPGYLELLDRHGVAWTVLTCDDPGVVLYEDDVQVVSAPHPA